jgi:hypothetical protein
MALETRIAMIGVVGALTGTLVGGLVTYAVTQDQISSQKAESRRTERLDAYAKYFGDASRLWTRVFAIMEGGDRPTTLAAADRTELSSLEETLIGEYALISLVAPKKVVRAAGSLYGVDLDVWNALNSAPIDVGLYNQAKATIRSKTSPLSEFEHVTRADLGTAQT